MFPIPFWEIDISLTELTSAFPSELLSISNFWATRSNAFKFPTLLSSILQSSTFPVSVVFPTELTSAKSFLQSIFRLIFPTLLLSITRLFSFNWPWELTFPTLFNSRLSISLKLTNTFNFVDSSIWESFFVLIILKN